MREVGDGGKGTELDEFGGEGGVELEFPTS